MKNWFFDKSRVSLGICQRTKKIRSMKKIFYLCIPFFLLTACNRPLNLLEKGKDKKALKASLNRLKNGKINSSHIYVLESSFQNITISDANRIQQLKEKGEPKLWLEILDEAYVIHKRQTKVNKVIHRLNRKGYNPEIKFYPAKKLIKEATDNVALYYYAKAQEYIPAARNNNKEAARKAYALILECKKYRVDFRDTDTLQNELYELGTTHILLEPITGDLRTQVGDRLLNNFLYNSKFPKRDKWKVLHIVEPSSTSMDYEIVFYFDQLRVVDDYERDDRCTNTETIQVGTTTEKVWSAKDSAYVEIVKPVYQDISVTVITTRQVKNSSLKLYGDIINSKTGRVEDDFILSNTQCWSNEYSRVCGDRRALGISCSDEGGTNKSPPYEMEQWLDAARCLRGSFYRCVKKRIY